MDNSRPDMGKRSIGISGDQKEGKKVINVCYSLEHQIPSCRNNSLVNEVINLSAYVVQLIYLSL